MAEVLLPTSGRGAEIRAYLEEALNLPKNLQWFDVRFALGEPVSVRCEFMPASAEEPAEEEPEEFTGHGSLDD